MADFCKQCSEEDFGFDDESLKGLCDDGTVVEVICEGCGHCIVNHLGECEDPWCLKKHGRLPEGGIRRVVPRILGT